MHCKIESMIDKTCEAFQIADDRIHRLNCETSSQEDRGYAVRPVWCGLTLLFQTRGDCYICASGTNSVEGDITEDQMTRMVGVALVVLEANFDSSCLPSRLHLLSTSPMRCSRTEGLSFA